MLDVDFEFVAWSLWTFPINKSISIHYQWSSTNWQHSCTIDCWTFARQTWLHKNILLASHTSNFYQGKVMGTIMLRSAYQTIFADFEILHIWLSTTSPRCLQDSLVYSTTIASYGQFYKRWVVFYPMTSGFACLCTSPQFWQGHQHLLRCRQMFCPRRILCIFCPWHSKLSDHNSQLFIKNAYQIGYTTPQWDD